jgi:hypothetical protein
VVAGATITQLLHPHSNRRRLWPLHALGCWSGPRPFPLTGRLMEPLDLNASPWVIKVGRVPSTVGGHAPTGLHQCMGPRHRVNRGRWREKKKTSLIRSWWSPALYKCRLTHRTARISIGPQGRPQGPLAPRTTMSPTSPTLSLAVPQPPTLPSIKARSSGSSMSSDLKSLCGNRVLLWFACFTTLTIKCHAPGSWDSTVVPSR